MIDVYKRAAKLATELDECEQYSKRHDKLEEELRALRDGDLCFVAYTSNYFKISAPGRARKSADTYCLKKVAEAHGLHIITGNPCYFTGANDSPGIVATLKVTERGTIVDVDSSYSDLGSLVQDIGACLGFKVGMARKKKVKVPKKQ